jgi:hypothetical protein
MHGYPTVTYISTDDRGLPDAPPLPRRRRWRSRLPSLPMSWPPPIVSSTADFTAAIAIAAAAVSAAAITHYPSRYPIQCPSPHLILSRCSAAVSAAIVTALPSPLLANCCQPRCGCTRVSLSVLIPRPAGERRRPRLRSGRCRETRIEPADAGPCMHRRVDCTKCGPTAPHIHKGPGRAALTRKRPPPTTTPTPPSTPPLLRPQPIWPWPAALTAPPLPLLPSWR